MYVPCVVNGRAVSALVDTGATHNFVSNGMALELGLKTRINSGKIKAVNSQATRIVGIARNVPISLGEYEGRLDLTVIELDDFDLILGISFMRSAGVGVFPQLEGILIANEAGASFVRGQRGPSGVKNNTIKEEHLSAMQVTRVCTGDLTDLVGTVEIRSDKVVVVSNLLVAAKTTELPKGSPEKTIVQQIELVPGRVPAPAHYSVVPDELTQIQMWFLDGGKFSRHAPWVTGGDHVEEVPSSFELDLTSGSDGWITRVNPMQGSRSILCVRAV